MAHDSTPLFQWCGGSIVNPGTSLSDETSAPSNRLPRHFPQGETCEVVVAYVDNPTRFYVHRAEERNEADKLVKRITTWATEPRNIRPLAAVNLNLGYMYAGRWSNVSM